VRLRITDVLYDHVCLCVFVSSRKVLKSYTHGDGKHEIDLLWPYMVEMATFCLTHTIVRWATQWFNYDTIKIIEGSQGDHLDLNYHLQGQIQWL
jgi:hypothetical protein